MTNSERIRILNEKELAEFLLAVHNSSCEACCNNFDRCRRNNAWEPDCKRHILEWLKSEEICLEWPKHIVKIKRNGQPAPERHGEWYDLATAEDVYLKKGEHQKIPLGVAMEMPPGYYAMMAPRSSTFERWGILQANSICIYEHDYCGNNDIWAFPAYATREVMIPKGTRICQFQIFPQHPPIAFECVDTMENESRGGWGSTGI